MEGMTDERRPDSQRAWIKLQQRLRDEHLVPDQPVATRHRLVPGTLAAAAAVLVLAVIAWAAWFQLSRKPATEQLSLDTSGESGTLVRTLSDGSVVYLAPGSRFSFPLSFPGGERRVSLAGKAFFDIAPDPHKPFVIETGDALVRVLGTAFHLNTACGQGMELLVERGKVNLSLKKDPAAALILKAGEKATAGEGSLKRSAVTAADDTLWYCSCMHFRDETLTNILHVLNRNFHTNFTVADDRTGRRKLTVTFQGEAPEVMAGLISAALNLKSRLINGAVVFSENDSPSGSR